MGLVPIHSYSTIDSSGDVSGGETPSSIPNLEVKPSSADGTALVAVWESRSLPGDLFVWALVAGSLRFLFAVHIPP